MSGISSRNQPRIKMNIPLNNLVVEGKLIEQGVLGNISLGGALLVAQGGFHLGDRVEIELPLPDSKEVIKCVGLMTRISSATQTGQELGVRFIEMPFSTMRRLTTFIAAVLAQG